MLAFLGIGPIGGLVGMIVAVWAVLRYRGGKRSAGAVAGRGALVVLAIAALSAGGLYLLYETNAPINPGGPAPRLIFEIRLPASAVLPGSSQEVDIEMHSEHERIPADFADNWRRLEDGRPVLAGHVELYQRTPQRLLVLRLSEQPARLFRLDIGRNPSGSKEFGAWQRVSFVDDMKADSHPRMPSSDDDFDIRYRVERAD
jgi:hypothetical protein